MTDKRLGIIAGQVRKGKRFADIGTDHAYLPVFLVKNGICPSGFACDINEKPLNVAGLNIKGACMQDRIQTVLSDGLENIDPYSVDDIIIAGMGGELITRILSNASWVKDSRLRLILQPMTRPEALRKFLFENGFEIIFEMAAEENSKLYTVISAEYTGGIIEFSELDIYSGLLLKECSETNIRFLFKTLKSLSFAYKGAKILCDTEKTRYFFDLINDFCERLGADINDYCE